MSLNWEKFSQAIALVNINADAENFSLLSQLIAEASDRYPQLSQLRCERIPLPSLRLESWSYWLAAQIVKQWRDLPPVAAYPPVATAIAELGLSSAQTSFLLVATLDQTTTDISLTQQLAARVQSLDKQQQQRASSGQQQWLDQEIAKLAKWFNQPLSATPLSPVAESGGMAQLQSNVFSLRSRLQYQLQASLPQLPQAGSRAILSWLSAFGKALAEIQALHEAQQQHNLRCESSAWRAYYNLRASQPKRHRRWSNQEHRWEVILRAATKALNFRLQAELHGYAAQLVSELGQQARQSATAVAQVDTVLADLEKWFNHHSAVESLFLPVLSSSLLKRVSPTQMLSQLETEIDRPLQQWDVLESGQIAVLCQQLLAKTQPLCLEVYAECCRYLLNLDFTGCQTQTTMLASSAANSERRVSLQVQNADIRDVLTVLGQAHKVKVVVDDSISGEISLVLNDASFTEALNALTAVSNLTYSQRGNIYTFRQLANKEIASTDRTSD